MESRTETVNKAETLVVRIQLVVDTVHVLLVDTGYRLDHSMRAVEVDLAVPVFHRDNVALDLRMEQMVLEPTAVSILGDLHLGRRRYCTLSLTTANKHL